MRRPDVVLLVALVLVGSSACERNVTARTRPLALHGLPSCPPRVGYARPIVVRLDRDRSIFEETYSTQVTIDAPPTGESRVVTLPIARIRMKATLRLGLCVSTSLGTWDCAAPSWLSITELALDGREAPFDVDVPKIEAPCADGSIGKPLRR